MLELKEYQQRALDAFEGWLKALDAAHAEGTGDFPGRAWEMLRSTDSLPVTAGIHIPRTDGAVRPIPHVCFKVPTGGGKTLLGATALERLNRPTGLVVWVVPSRIIYAQTIKALNNREHPYRQTLNRASGGRVKILEKDDHHPFTPEDLANYLCVMLLMFPAANRRKDKEFLKINRDSGGYERFFPDLANPLGDGELLRDHPGLARTKDGRVLRSLQNVIKMQRPVIVLDEAHKAYGAQSARANREFAGTISSFDPRMVIELSATPNPGISNLLVDISGVEVKEEEMIKLPIQVSTVRQASWKHTLARAQDELDRLTKDAERLYANEGRYIRPIAVVRVERTGKEQRDGEHVHSDDVKEYLTTTLSVPESEVGLKTAEVDDIGNADLLSPNSRFRWIITKDALKEGWDCSFAYVLVLLDRTQANTALTQLVGRVLRQPDARLTNVPRLDQCYVYCWDAQVGAAVGMVRRGLEAEGLGDVAYQVRLSEEETQPDGEKMTIKRRPEFQGKEIYLPKVLHREDGEWRDLSYERHILRHVDWGAIDVALTRADLQESVDERSHVVTREVDVGMARPSASERTAVEVDTTPQISWYARRLADIVPNPWQAARIAGAAIESLLGQRIPKEELYGRRNRIADVLRGAVARQVDALARDVFVERLNGNEISFSLDAGNANYRLIDTREFVVPGPVDSLNRRDGYSLQLSLFDRVLRTEFDSELERNFASHLDEHAALTWWHRVAAGQSGEYYLRGWRRNRIWPDFVAMANWDTYHPTVMVFETKGDRFKELDDTQYKQRVFSALEDAYNGRSVGQMVIRQGPAKGCFRIVFSLPDGRSFEEPDACLGTPPAAAPVPTPNP